MLSITLPAILRAGDYHEFVLMEEAIEAVLAPNTFSAMPSRLPKLHYIELGFADGSYCAYLYSPRLLGKKLNEKNVWEHAVPILLDHLNAQYLSEGKRKHTCVPLSALKEHWEEAFEDNGLLLKDEYEAWRAGKQHAVLTAALSPSPAPSRARKI